MSIYKNDIVILNKILRLSINNKEPISVNTAAKELNITRDESHRLLYEIWEYDDKIDKIGKTFKYNSDNVNFEADVFTKKFIDNGGFYQLLNLKEMTDNEIIHRILEYVCSAESQSSIDTEQIANEFNLSLAVTNRLVQQIIDNGDAKDASDKDTAIKGAIGLLKIVDTKDAYETKKYLIEKEIRYNIYISTNFDTYNLMDLPEPKLDIVIDAYKKGKKSFTISGKKHWFHELQTIKIFTYNKLAPKGFFEYCERKGILGRNSYNRSYYLPQALDLLGNDVTDDKIGDLEFGEDAETRKVVNKNGEFVNEKHLNDLKTINNSSFDLTRLIKLCEELNDNFNRGNYLSVGMILRTIINHVPPIFRVKSFQEVANNYGGPKDNISFKKNMKHLNDSLKNIANNYLHQVIRKKESLPTATQVDFRQDFDVLLGEIVRILK